MNRGTVPQRILLVAGLVLVLGSLVLCSVQSRPPGHLYVYLKREASAADISALRSYLGSDQRVTGVAYVTRGMALERWRKKYSTLPTHMRGTLLPEWLDVTVRDAADTPAVIAHVNAFGAYGRTVDEVTTRAPRY